MEFSNELPDLKNEVIFPVLPLIRYIPFEFVPIQKSPEVSLYIAEILLSNNPFSSEIKRISFPVYLSIFNIPFSPPSQTPSSSDNKLNILSPGLSSLKE